MKIKKIIKYSVPLIVAISYITTVLYLGLGIRDDYFGWAFPSWPYLIGCFENCGYKIILAVISNGILIGVIILGIFYIIELSIFLIKKLIKKQ